MTSTFKHLAAGTVLALALSGAGATAAVASPTHQPASASAQTGAERHMNHDRHFAVMMVPHHQGATDMAELALQKSERPEIRDLAEKIIEAQTEEIQQLEAAAQRLTAENTSGHHHHGHGGHGQSMNADMQGAMMDEMDEMDGMDGMSLEELAKLSGDEFDQAFLEQMIAHHQMALEMAEMELQMGTDLELRAMAEKMIEDQQAEIELMQGWLEEWFAA